MQELIDLIKKHTPDLVTEHVYCTCGAVLSSPDAWAAHLANEIEANFPAVVPGIDA